MCAEFSTSGPLIFPQVFPQLWIRLWISLSNCGRVAMAGCTLGALLAPNNCLPIDNKPRQLTACGPGFCSLIPGASAISSAALAASDPPRFSRCHYLPGLALPGFQLPGFSLPWIPGAGSTPRRLILFRCLIDVTVIYPIQSP